jgi:hypothetical protein
MKKLEGKAGVVTGGNNGIERRLLGDWREAAWARRT